MKKEIVVAMSGGVDSAVSALLLMEQGYDVVGVNLKVWEYEAQSCEPTKKSCCSPKDIIDARDVGFKLNIPFYVLRMEKVFKENVMDRFVLDYSTGRTPNPCVECNTFVKFGALFEKAQALGIGGIATGHYARIHRLPNGRFAIRAGVDEKKNQAYYLYGLSQEALAQTQFPLGEMEKPEVRELARKFGLPVADKPESQEICFVPENDYRSFLKRSGLEFTPGFFKDMEGRILGKHTGKEQFTVGQRKGLGIAWKEPLYVVSIEDNGDVILGTQNDTYCVSFLVEQSTFQGLAENELYDRQNIECRVQIRYRSKPVKARIQALGKSDVVSWNGRTKGNLIKVTLEENVSSITPGQSAVFFPKWEETPNDYILAGGIISRESLEMKHFNALQSHQSVAPLVE